MTEPLNWESRCCKRAQDERVNALLDIPPGLVSMLSLPASGWCYEKQLAKAYPDIYWRFTGLEYDPQVFAHMQTPPTANAMFEAKHMSVQAAMEVLEPHDIVYLDYLGGWSESVEADIRKMAALRRVRSQFLLVVKATRMSKNHGVCMDALNSREAQIDWSTRASLTGKTRSRLAALPSRVEQLCYEEDLTLRFERGFLYDSWNTGRPDMFGPEIVMSFNVNKEIS